jgi:hypothetical protein
VCPLTIEKNVPFPATALPKIPFKEMEQKDSVLINLKEKNDLNNIRQRVYRENAKGKKKFSCYQVDTKSVRIYRTT